MMSTPATDLLEAQFGPVYADILFQSDKRRMVCTRVVADDQPVALSIAYINARTARKYLAVHSKIQAGELIGQAFRATQVDFTRDILENAYIEIPPIVHQVFPDVDAKEIIAKKVSISVGSEKEEYAKIFELYSPSVTLSDVSRVNSKAPNKDIGAIFRDPTVFVILQLRQHDLNSFLRLAHGFLKKRMHVGVEDAEDFVTITQTTAEALVHDDNTRIFVARNAREMIGYISINFHPALHINGVECVIREVFVKEDSRLQGAGRNLVQYVERFARRKKMKRISLATNWDHPDQRTFYEKLGFTRRCDFVVKYLTAST